MKLTPLPFLGVQFDGVDVEQYRTTQRDLVKSQKRLVAAQLELQAARDKLDIYRRTEGVVGTGR